MDTLIHADIFFFITAVAVMLIATMLAVVLVYVVLIARDVRAIVARMRRASESLESDFNALREGVLKEGGKAKALVGLALGFIGRKLGGSPRKKRAAKTAKQGQDSKSEEE